MLLKYIFKFANCMKLRWGIGIEVCIKFVKEHIPNSCPITISLQLIYLFVYSERARWIHSKQWSKCSRTKVQQSLLQLKVFFPSAVDLEPFSSESSSRLTLLMYTISSTKISDVQPMNITSSIFVVTMPTTDMLAPTWFEEDDTKLLVVWSSIGRLALHRNGPSYSHASNLFLFAI